MKIQKLPFASTRASYSVAFTVNKIVIRGKSVLKCREVSTRVLEGPSPRHHAYKSVFRLVLPYTASVGLDSSRRETNCCRSVPGRSICAMVQMPSQEVNGSSRIGRLKSRTPGTVRYRNFKKSEPIAFVTHCCYLFYSTGPKIRRIRTSWKALGPTTHHTGKRHLDQSRIKAIKFHATTTYARCGVAGLD